MFFVSSMYLMIVLIFLITYRITTPVHGYDVNRIYGAGMIILICLGVFFCLLNSSEATRCFECNNVTLPRDCAKLTTCNSDENCFTEQVITAGGYIVYNSGCLSKSKCSVSGVPKIVGKRTVATSAKRSTDASICSECCNGDFCNNKGCGAQEIPIKQRGPYCYNCDVLDPMDCNSVAVCAQNELCMMYNPYNVSGFPETIYRGQCVQSSACAILTLLHSNERCTPMCCNTDFCNDHCAFTSVETMTTSHPQTTKDKTIDKTQTSEKLTSHQSVAFTTQLPVTSTTTTQTTITPTDKIIDTTQTSEKLTSHQSVVTSATTTQTTITPTDKTIYKTQTPEKLTSHQSVAVTTQLPLTSTTTTQTTITSTGTTYRTTIPSTNAPFRCNTQGSYIHLRSANAELCVHIVLKHATWNDARSACKHEGADLAVLDTYEKSLLMSRKLHGSGHTGYWIGAKDFEKDDHFLWVNHYPVDNSKADWGHGQPDHHHYGQQQDCVEMLEDNYDWHDSNCFSHFNYICERK